MEYESRVKAYSNIYQANIFSSFQIPTNTFSPALNIPYVNLPSFLVILYSKYICFNPDQHFFPAVPQKIPN